MQGHLQGQRGPGLTTRIPFMVAAAGSRGGGQVARAWYVWDTRHLDLGVGGSTPKLVGFSKSQLAVISAIIR